MPPPGAAPSHPALRPPELQSPHQPHLAGPLNHERHHILPRNQPFRLPRPLERGTCNERNPHALLIHLHPSARPVPREEQVVAFVRLPQQARPEKIPRPRALLHAVKPPISRHPRRRPRPHRDKHRPRAGSGISPCSIAASEPSIRARSRLSVSNPSIPIPSTTTITAQATPQPTTAGRFHSRPDASAAPR